MEKAGVKNGFRIRSRCLFLGAAIVFGWVLLFKTIIISEEGDTTSVPSRGVIPYRLVAQTHTLKPTGLKFSEILFSRDTLSRNEEGSNEKFDSRDALEVTRDGIRGNSLPEVSLTETTGGRREKLESKDLPTQSKDSSKSKRSAKDELTQIEKAILKEELDAESRSENPWVEKFASGEELVDIEVGVGEELAGKDLVIRLEGSDEEKLESKDARYETEDGTGEKSISSDALSKTEDGSRMDPCAGKYLYMHRLPRAWHEGLYDDCITEGKHKAGWPVCRDSVNMGFGQPMDNLEGMFPGGGWYVTSQWALEIIFYHKAIHYKCRTMDSSKADTVYVPFMSGVEVEPHLWDEEESKNMTHKMEVPRKVLDWVTSQPEWSRWNGHDHFMVTGRTDWDFGRNGWGWGNDLLLLEPMQNLTFLTKETKAPPPGPVNFAVPYPTHFHPNTDQQVFNWQDVVSKTDRKSLFCFAGAPRPFQDDSIRGQLMEQCRESEYCNLMDCGKNESQCFSRAHVTRLFEESNFCMQPAGDTYTRRSFFDTILAGCIPVLFKPESAYTQYRWFLPADHSTWSVFILEDNIRAGNISVEDVLRSFSPEDIESMRKVVISLIPRIIYSDPINNTMTMKDAFDLSLDGVIDRVKGYQTQLEVEKEHFESEALRRDLSGQGSFVEEGEEHPGTEALPSDLIRENNSVAVEKEPFE